LLIKGDNSEVLAEKITLTTLWKSPAIARVTIDIWALFCYNKHKETADVCTVGSPWD